MNKFIYGIHTINAILDHSHNRIKEFYYSKERKDYKLTFIIKKIRALKIPIIPVTRKWIDKKTNNAVHQGCIAYILTDKYQKENELHELLKQTKKIFLLVLDCITDQHNFGSCIRTAETAGVNAIIIPKNKSAQLNSISEKVACGAVEYIPIFRVTNLVRTLLLLRTYNIRIIGTTSKINNNIYQSNLKGNIAIIVGDEHKGIRRLTREHCDELINIPIIGTTDSLNVSVATGICLFEAVRQRLYN